MKFPVFQIIKNENLPLSNLHLKSSNRLMNYFEPTSKVYYGLKVSCRGPERSWTVFEIAKILHSQNQKNEDLARNYNPIYNFAVSIQDTNQSGIL